MLLRNEPESRRRDVTRAKRRRAVSPLAKTPGGARSMARVPAFIRETPGMVRRLCRPARNRDVQGSMSQEPDGTALAG